MAEYNGGVLVDENGNKYYPIASGLWCKEGNYGDQFAIAFNFGNTDDNNKMLFQGAVGASGEHPSLVDLMTLSGKSGNLWVKGNLDVPNKSLLRGGLYSYEVGNAGTPVGNGTLIIKRVDNTEAPNNGVVLEYGNSKTWAGQLYIGDNSYQGIFYNGWSNGVRGTWRRLMDEPVSLYDNSSGTTGTVSLSDSAANYKYLEIYSTRGSSDSMSNFVNKIYNPNGKNVTLGGLLPYYDDVYLYAKYVNISDSSITVRKDRLVQIHPRGVNIGNDDSHKIHKVLGYR